MNNNTHKRKKKNKEKEDFSVDNKVPKQQKMTTKADVTDMSAGIIDIDDTPDVATWNKKVHIKEDAVDIIASRQLLVLASEIRKHLKKIWL
jgi:hypothetical protein